MRARTGGRTLLAAAALVLAAAGPARAQVTIPVTPGNGPPMSGVTDVVDFSTLGTANNAAADNTAALVTLLARRTAGRPLVVYFPAGDWYFLRPMPVNDLAAVQAIVPTADLTIFDNVSLVGAPRGASVQHEEEGFESWKARSRIIVDLASEGEVWWDQRRAYTFGPHLWQDLAIRVEDVGSAIQYGDPAINTIGAITMRGLCLERVYLSRRLHYGGANVGDGRAWLVSSGADGWVLNRTNTSFGLRMNHVFDARLDVLVRGWKHGVVNHWGDCPRGHVRGITCGMALLETGAPVGAQWDRVWGENCLLGGAVLNGQTALFRGETNPSNYAVAPGVYGLPTSARWSVAAGASTIAFTFSGAYDCRDYFEPWTYVRLQPQTDQTNGVTNTAEPPLEALVTAVTATTVTFYEATNKNYVARQIVGRGDAIQRHFGVPLVAYGNRADVASVSAIVNQNAAMPFAVVAPSQTPLRFAGNASGRGDDANSPQETRIIARCAGDQEGMQGGVDLLGSAGRSNHPLANAGGTGPRFERRFREPLWDPHSRTQVFQPGRGVSSIDWCAREGTFHWLTESDGQTVAAYRLSDFETAGGWYLRPLKRTGVDTVVTVRYYVPTGTPTLAYYGGGTGVPTDALATGWNTIQRTMTAAQMAADGNGNFLRLSGSGIYVTSVVVDQE